MKAGRIIGGLIILAFLATMVALVRRESATELPALGDGDGTLFGGVTAAAKWQDIDEWMLIRHHDAESDKTATIGAAHTSIIQLDHPTTAAAYQADFGMEGKISALLPRITVKGTAILDKDANLSKFLAKADGVGLTLSAQGEVRDNLLFIKINKPNGISYSRRRLMQSVSLSEALRPSLSRHMEIKPGAKMSSPVIDPLTGHSRGKLTVHIEKAETINIAGRPIKAYRVKTSVGDIDTLMWVDGHGRTLRRNLVSGFFMERTTRENALEQAPTLGRQMEIPALDFGEFDGIPVQGATSAENGTPDNNSSINNLLNAILG